MQEIPVNPNDSNQEEVPVNNNEIKSILESDEEEEEEKEKKRSYAPSSLVKKSKDEVKIMATLTPSEVRNEDA